MLAWKKEGTKIYQQLPQQCFDTLKKCEPLREAQNQPINFNSNYQPLKK
jgi:hypothetical protein